VKNKIEDLRNHLFATIEALRDEEKPMDLDRARTIADVAQVVINSAKVEVDMLKTTGGTTGTGFIRQDATPGNGNGNGKGEGAERPRQRLQSMG
jgi:hypothetical protein